MLSKPVRPTTPWHVLYTPGLFKLTEALLAERGAKTYNIMWGLLVTYVNSLVPCLCYNFFLSFLRVRAYIVKGED